jgi:hypothetical protein
MKNYVNTKETFYKFKTLESLVGTTWGYRDDYLLRVVDASHFVWLMYDRRSDHRFCLDGPRRLYAPSDLGGYERYIITPDDPHAETDF